MGDTPTNSTTPDASTPDQLPLPSQQVQSFTPGTTPPLVAGSQPIQPMKAPAALSPDAPHAKLANMVAGLMEGLSAAGTSIATRGKEGGAKEVAAYQQQQQEMAQSKAAAQQAITDAQFRNQETQSHTNYMNTQNYNAIASHKAEMSKLDMEAASAGIKTNQEAQNFWNDNARSAPGWYTDPKTGGQVQGSAPPMAQGAKPPVADINTPLGQKQNIVLEGFEQTLPGDKTVTDARKVFDNPTSTPDQRQHALNMVRIRAGVNDTVMADLTKKADLKVKDEQTQASAFKLQQDKVAQDVYTRQVPKDAAGQPTEDFATWQARSNKAAEIAVSQGDLTHMGEMAAEGLLTIPQIALSRQMDKKGFQQFLDAADAKAKELGQPEIMVNGKPTGHYFNSVAATQQYDYVKAFNAPGSKTQQSISSGSTFMEHMNDLLNVNAKYARTNNKILNTPLNKIGDLFGNATYAEYLASIAPVKTEYDNALKAGFAPTAEDSATVDLLLKPNSTPTQIETAGKVMAHTILRRLDSTNQGYKTHTNADYPNMLTPDAATALAHMGLDTGGLQSGGSFGGVAQAGVTPGKTQAAAPTGATHEVKVSGKLVGHVVDNKYVPLPQ